MAPSRLHRNRGSLFATKRGSVRHPTTVAESKPALAVERQCNDRSTPRRGQPGSSQSNCEIMDRCLHRGTTGAEKFDSWVPADVSIGAVLPTATSGRLPNNVYRIRDTVTLRAKKRKV